MKNFFPAGIVIMLVIIFAGGCEKESKMPVVARVGDLQISQEEFELAYRFNPALGIIKSDTVARRIVLNSLIAKKLWALEGYARQLDKKPVIREMTEQYRREALIERFWEKKIFSNIKIGEQEIRNAYFRSKRKRIIQFLVSDNERRAQDFAAQLQNGVSFERLAALLGYDIRQIPVDSVSFGYRFEKLEQTVFDMKMNEVRGPITLGHRYFFVKLIGEKQDIFTAEIDLEAQRRKLVKTLRDRKRKTLFEKYVAEHLPQKYELDKSVFKKLARALEKQLQFERSGNPQPFLSAIEKTLDTGEELLRQPVVTFPDGENWTVEQLLKRLRTGPYPLETSSPGNFRNSIIAATRMNLDDELLAKHAAALGLGGDEKVEIITAFMKDDLVATAMKRDWMRKNSSSGDDEKQPAEKIDNFLCDRLTRTGIYINWEKLRGFPAKRADMLVFKTHFPSRTIGPPLELVDYLPQFNKLLRDIRNSSPP